MEEIPSKYSPLDVEEKWIAKWEQQKLYQANPESKKPPFSMVMPPPNVTGKLHMGHVLGNTLQDILARYKRMQGFEVLWQLGVDHAGIATQTVVERNLIKTEGKRRKDLSRDDFEKLCWAWTEKHQKEILSQIKRLGCSCDYSRPKFTLDPEINQAVLKLFKKLFDEKLIYRGYYLVNWDPITQTALADDEVEYEEKKDALYYIKYPLKDLPEHIIIATTRPETLLGDTAVAVSPKDPRYLELIGQKIKLPLTDREIPIISDHYVDPEFGTGAVKITPAHDFNDYEVGQRQNLAMINIMTSDGHINQNGGAFAGLSMQDARKKIVEELKEMGLMVKIEPHTHRVGTSYRSKAVIEPHLSKQWFISMKPFAKKLKEAVENNLLTLTPKNWESTYFHWIDNLRDWCISRQLWWGHRIPVWYNKEDPEKIICHIEDGLPQEVIESPDQWRQEEDVLDTWFSSGLWPFSTLGWPQKTPELEKFYPNNLLITGHDILFFWVARMMMMGEYAVGKLPFNQVLLTGLIYGKSYWRKGVEGGIAYVSQQERSAYDMGKTPPKDVHSKWEKISKSKGNAIDPREIIELYGTCAMRMALASTSCQLRQIDLDRRKFEEYKNFANKVWNGARFVMTHLQSLPQDALEKGLDLDSLQLEDRWILLKLSQTVLATTQFLDTYKFDQAAQTAYEFFWNEFCAYYLEVVKPTLFGKEGAGHDQNQKKIVLFIVLNASIRLLHPMAPFITEELFEALQKIFPQRNVIKHADAFTHNALKALDAKSCMAAPYPRAFEKASIFNHADSQFSFLKQLIYTIRNIRGEMKLPPSVATDLYLEGDQTPLIQENLCILKALLPLKTIYLNEPCSIAFSASNQHEKTKITLPLPEELMAQEKERLVKEQQKKIQNLESFKKKLDNPNFVERAPPELVKKQKDLISLTEQELVEINEKLSKI